MPTLWIVPTDLESTAIRAVAQIAAVDVGNVNPLAGRLQINTEPRLTSATTSYLVVPPAQMDGLVQVSLEGQGGPYTESWWGFEVDALQVKIRFDVGVGAIECRSWTRLDHSGA
jgi:hypothetical protein